MRREGPSITFTVYFDGQFWVGTVERVEEGGLSAARVVFGAEPSEEEILKFILERWDTLRFSQHQGAAGHRRDARAGQGGGPEEERRREEGDRIAQARPALREAQGETPRALIGFQACITRRIGGSHGRVRMGG